MNEIHTKISQNIIKYRLVNQLKQKTLAMLLGISPKTMSDIECARKKVSFNTLLKISSVLHVTLDMLLEGTLSIQLDVPNPIYAGKLLRIDELLTTASLKRKLSFMRILDLYDNLK